MATPRLGEIAPDFEATTTEGPIRFHDWKDASWAVLFSHPADFTPVCTTELGRVAALDDEWTKRGVKVLAVSVDPIEQHEEWKGDIEEVSGATVGYPIIADDSRQVSELYDMIHPGEGDTSGVRSVFIIDPANKVRLSLTYPKSVGRNFDEILRAVDALQLTDSGPSRRRPTGARARRSSSPRRCRRPTPASASATTPSTRSSPTCASPPPPPEPRRARRRWSRPCRPDQRRLPAFSKPSTSPPARRLHAPVCVARVAAL